MEARIVFKNGESLTAEQNGNTFITNTVPEFPDDLTEVNVFVEDQQTTLHYVIIQEAASIDGRYWFCLVEEQEGERIIREQEEKITFLEDCLMEMSEEVYK